MPESATHAAAYVVDYDPDWPRIFFQLKNHIWPAVCDVALAIEHVGSTSVPGMAAKPVIDVDVVIASQTSLLPLITRLESLGYQHRGNLGIENREAFITPENQPPHHLYSCIQNSLALHNHIAFRDYLRTHPSEAAAYSALKRGLGKRFAANREHYQEAKTGFVLSILAQCGISAEDLDSIRRCNQK